MAKNIEPKLKKIGEYLKLEEDAVFRIPEYQRAYSWQTENCDKLWQDVVDYADSNAKERYFFGTIIINCEDNDTKLNLIDGQQRTTTFFLLMKALLIRVNEAIGSTAKDPDSESLCRGLKERRRTMMGILYKAEAEDIPDLPSDRDVGICQSVNVLINDSNNERYDKELDAILKSVTYQESEQSTVRIPYKQKDNRLTNFFRNFKRFYEKAGELSDSQLNTVAKTLIDNCEVIEIKSWQVEQAINMFNSLNSDGMPLCDADIISAQLYKEAKLLDKGEEFSDLWQTFMRCIEDMRKTNIASVDAVLMQLMYYIRTINGETISEKGSIIVTTPGLRRYFKEINPAALKQPIDFCKQLIHLAEAWKKVSEYPAIQVLTKFNDNFKLFLASYFMRFKTEDISQESMNELLESFLKLFTILELIDAGYSSKYFKTFLFGIEGDLADPAVDVHTIREKFDTHIRNSWNEGLIRDLILDYDGYALVYLNEYLFAKETGAAFSLSGKHDVEHIMPMSGRNTQIVQQDAGIESADEFDGLVNKLGNKIVLEERINRAIGNEWFRTKVSTRLKQKTGYVDSAFPMARALVEKYRDDKSPYWKKDDIEAETQKATDRICSFIFGEASIK